MFESLIFFIVVGGGCWCLKQWLGYLERKQLAEKITQRQVDEGQPITPLETRLTPLAIQRHQAAVTEIWQPPQAKTGGMNKWLVMGLCAFYILWPIDILPDFIPVLGWGDDIVAAVIGLRQLFKSA